MRRSFLHLLVPFVTVATLSGQAFEGVVMVKMAAMSMATGDAKYLIKGPKTVVVMTLGANSGPMAGKEMRMITDMTTMKSTMLIPMEMGGMKGMKMEIDLNKAAGNAGKAAEVKSLGTSETIAGYKCENMQFIDGKNVTTMCMNTQLGTFTFPGGGGMGRGSPPPAWVNALGGKPGFPLRVTGSDGKVVMEVTSVQPGRVAAEEFVIPEGYSSMPGMGGRGGGL